MLPAAFSSAELPFRSEGAPPRPGVAKLTAVLGELLSMGKSKHRAAAMEHTPVQVVPSATVGGAPPAAAQDPIGRHAALCPRAARDHMRGNPNETVLAGSP
jgi:hypothetical protein